MCIVLLPVCSHTYTIPDNLSLAGVAPLLCAGITTYSPYKDHNLDKPGYKIGVVGLGGLGHMAVKFGVAFGCEVYVISRLVHRSLHGIFVYRAAWVVGESATPGAS